MQSPSYESLTTTILFSRERRRRRMLQFLEAFERRSWPCAPEQSFMVPWSKNDLRPSELTSTSVATAGR
ncbi:MAG: hypothetical protein V4773_04335 [Verrucomicrobiota bacterium]